MTRASRPTFEAARGGRGKGEGDLSQLSKQHSSRDLPYTKIKYRQTTQDAPEEVRNRDFRRELEERELLLEKKIGIIQLEEEDEDEDFEEESDDDGTAALLAELERIKKERAEEQARKNSQRCSVIHIKKSKNQLILQHRTTKTNLTGWHRSYLPQEESGGGQWRRRACADLGRASALPLPPGPQRPRRSRLAAPPSSERPREH
ncbi:spliceosome-associated protein CWC15 homolog isoform X5 [Manis javanica]|uniref:spliceosome-associated protein CWC15 homolog isoform X5 n=1 Tax=Manis javanica TaxID=9974 RepID=UPI003C6D6F44